MAVDLKKIPEGWVLLYLGDHSIYWNRCTLMNVKTKMQASGTASNDEEAFEKAIEDANQQMRE